MSARPSRSAATKAAMKISQIMDEDKATDDNGAPRKRAHVGPAPGEDVEAAAPAPAPAPGPSSAGSRAIAYADGSDDSDGHASVSDEDDEDEEDGGDYDDEAEDVEEVERVKAVKVAKAAVKKPAAAAPRTPVAAKAASPKASTAKKTAVKAPSAKQLAAMLGPLSHADIVATLGKFFEGPGAPVLHDFLSMLPATNTDAMIAELNTASRKISRLQPRYSSGNGYAFNRCKSAVSAFNKAVASQVSALKKASDWAALIDWAPKALDVIADCDVFDVSSYQMDNAAKIGAALLLAKKAKGLSPELRKKVDALFAANKCLTPKPAVKPAALFMGVGSHVIPQ